MYLNSKKLTRRVCVYRGGSGPNIPPTREIIRQPAYVTASEDPRVAMRDLKPGVCVCARARSASPFALSLSFCFSLFLFLFLFPCLGPDLLLCLSVFLSVDQHIAVVIAVDCCFCFCFGWCWLAVANEMVALFFSSFCFSPHCCVPFCSLSNYHF
jgi:hypothetical protein